MKFVFLKTGHGNKRGEVLDLSWCGSRDDAINILAYIGLFCGVQGLLVV